MPPLSYDSPLAILVADDEPSVLLVLESMLQESGHVVGTASNGEEALVLFRQKQWDIVLTDRFMAEMDGDALALAIKEVSPRTPVVMVTGSLPRKTPPGVECLVSKPFSRAALAEAITRALQTRAISGDSSAPPFSAAA